MPRIPQVHVAAQSVFLKADRSPEEIAVLKKILTFKLVDDGQFAGREGTLERTIKCFEETETTFSVPRCFPIPPQFQIVSEAVVGEPVDVSFTGTLRNDPKNDQEAAVDALCAKQNGILTAVPGKGKTTMAIAAACRMKRRTVFVVPNTMLLEQWVDRIVSFTDLKKEDIGIVQGPRCDHHKPFIVAMLQTLSQRDFPELFSKVGVVFFDESHVLGAETFLTVLPKFPAQMRFGLSATPKRKDHMDKAVGYHLGPILFTMGDQDLKPTVMMITTPFKVPDEKWKNKWNEQFAMSKLFSELTKIPKRNHILAVEISKAAMKGRKILALSRRIEQLQEVKIRVEVIFREQKFRCVMNLLTGKTKNADRPRILKTSRVIFATDQIAGTGLDQPDLDTLVFLCPSQNLEQNAGRIERVCEGKSAPVIVDLADQNDIFLGMARSRLRKYAERGYEILKFTRS